MLETYLKYSKAHLKFTDLNLPGLLADISMLKSSLDKISNTLITFAEMQMEKQAEEEIKNIKQ